MAALFHSVRDEARFRREWEDITKLLRSYLFCHDESLVDEEKEKGSKNGKTR